MSYNGWTNYETWCVNLWLENEESTYNDLREMAKEEENAEGLADRLKDYTETLLEDLTEGGGLAADLILSALGVVDWFEIAEKLIEDREGEVN